MLRFAAIYMYMTELGTLNPGQQRKIRIIGNIFGSNWREQHPGMAIDAVYNLAIRDERKSVFCKINKDQKQKLMEMIAHYDITMGDFISMMIDIHFEQYTEQRLNIVSGIADDYSG